MTILSSSDYDPGSFSTYLKFVVDQVNSDTGSELLSSKNYDKQIQSAILKQIVDVVNDNYGSSIKSSAHYDDNSFSEILKEVVDAVNAGLPSGDYLLLEDGSFLQFEDASGDMELGGGYYAHAVRFPDNSAYLLRTSTGIADSGKYTAVGWVKFPAASLNGYTSDLILSWPDSADLHNDHLDIAGRFNSDLSLGVQSNDGTSYFNRGSLDGAIPSGTWAFVASGADTTGSGEGFLLINGVSVINDPYTASANLPFTSSWSNVCVPAGNPDPGSYGFANPFYIADLQVWVGTYIDLTDSENYEKFVSSGKPVDPSIAADEFGQPAIKFSGNADNFPSNQGSGGSFNLFGTLSNSGVSPSD